MATAFDTHQRKQSKHRTINKIRFIEPGNLPYKFSLKNLYTYDKYLRTPSTGLMILTTVVKRVIEDTLMYSESISKVKWKDVFDADIVFIGFFTFAASRGYRIAHLIRRHSNALIVTGGLHASLDYKEAVNHCDYVLLGECEESILDFIKVIQNNSAIDFQGIAYKNEKGVIFTGFRDPPENIDIIPNRDLLHGYRKKVWYNTIWPQVHASRGCPHNCEYCAPIRHFGRKLRTRSPENVAEDIRQSIAFHKSLFLPRLNRALWITDDNFFANRDWARSVLQTIIEKKIKYRFTIQARYEVGFDDEMLDLLKQAGFFEIAIGMEFLEDESFERYNKKCTYGELVRSIKNIQRHGLNVRGLFIVGADDHTRGTGDKIASFVIKHNINGILIQSMYFVPGTPLYDQYKGTLIHEDWSKYKGNVVHIPKNISASDLQKEIILASKKIYSFKRLASALVHKRGFNKLLFIGEFF